MAKRKSIKAIYAELEAANRAAPAGMFVIADLDGSNRRTITMEQFRVENAIASARARAIHAANVATMARR